MTPEIVSKALALLKEAVPRAARIAILANPGNPFHPGMVRNGTEAASTLGIQLTVVNVTAGEGLEDAFELMARERTNALLVLSDGMFFFNRTRIADLALGNRLPSMFSTSELGKSGWLMAYAASSVDNYRRAATYVHKIFKGAKPGDLPIEQPSKFELVINLKTAKALGLTMPPSLLLRADQVIE